LKGLSNIRKIIRKTEFIVFLIILFLGIMVQIRSGQFFTGNNLIDIIRAMIVPGMFAIGCQMVIISGGIDVSFTAIALVAMYSTNLILLRGNYQGSILLPYIMAAGFGLIMGTINAVLISKFKFPTLIVTLGTASVFYGFVNGVLKANSLKLIDPLFDHGVSTLFSSYNSQLKLKSDMTVHVLILIVLILIAFFIMKYTIIGRGIYAIGGDEISATRAGLNISAIKFFIYCFAGMVAGITGLVQASMSQIVQPKAMVGMELVVIGAVVIGGTNVTGGYGSITGAILGVALLITVSNSMILLGVSTFWNQVFTGAFIVVGTGISAYQIKNSKKHLVSLNRGRE
jgi:Ribose/xylose/arabinose/galactoside ABC-type transport systems, permease components